LALGFVAVGLSVAAAAQTPAVDAARRGGLVGERFDGYLGYVVAPPGNLRAQVDAINIRRRALYSNLAASRGVTPQDVGVTAGCQLLARIASGDAYMHNDGRWRRRGAGSAEPDYCR
jgi:uncharacterized protein YdbL (DUF1318 family)